MAVKVISKKLARERRRRHIRKKVRGTQERPRLVVYRSNNAIYGQIINDIKGETLAAASTLSSSIREDIEKAESKVEQAKIAGSLLAKVAKDHKITKVVFDRAGYRYHGRVKAFADGAREGGLEL